MAQYVVDSLHKGNRVITEGTLKSRSYETREGEKRTVIELDVEEIGASLRYGAVTPAGRIAAGTAEPTEYDPAAQAWSQPVR